MKHQKTIEQEVINFIKENNLVPDGNKLLIALSGGADSVFALHFFHKYKNKFNLKISAIHVNHNLRKEESKRDEEFCKDLCEKLNIEFHVRNIDVRKNKSKASLEEAARNLRYNIFNDVLLSSKSDLIVTAHNRDDNTETVLLNIFSGTGLKGLTGIPVKRDNIIRPILTISKLDIINYLNEKKIKFIYDSSNDNLKFRRNFLRKKIIPLLKKEISPALDKVLLNSSVIFNNQMAVINSFTEIVSKEAVTKQDEQITVSINVLKKYPEEIIGEVLKKVLTENFNLEYSFKQFVKIKNLISSQTGKIVKLTREIISIRERDTIVIARKKKENIKEYSLKIGEALELNDFKIGIEEVKIPPQSFDNNSHVEYIDGEKINNLVKIRAWKAGDKIQLLGMKGTKNISDVLTDLKVPVISKKNQLVLTNKDELIWLIGKKLSEKYKITSKTKKILKLWIE